MCNAPKTWFLVPKFPKSPHRGRGYGVPYSITQKELLSLPPPPPPPIEANMHCPNILDFSGKDKKFGGKCCARPPPPKKKKKKKKKKTEMVPYAYGFDAKSVAVVSWFIIVVFFFSCFLIFGQIPKLCTNFPSAHRSISVYQTIS